MPPEPAPQWTPEQGRRYEMLRDGITIYVSNVMAEIDAERARPAPRAGLIAALRAHLIDVHRKRQALVITDDAQISATIDKFDALNQAFNTGSAY